MAGQSAKKISKNFDKKSKIYSIISIGSNLINLLSLLVLPMFHIAVTWWDITGSILLLGVSIVSFNMIKDSLEMGVGYSIWQDLFVINTFVQVMTITSRWFWLVYLTLPGYAVYTFGGQALTWVFAGRRNRPEEEPVSDKKNKKVVRR